MKMKLLILLVFSAIITQLINAQSISSQPFTVGGNGTIFYPVVFTETNWSDGATEFELSRTNVHQDATWWGSMIAKFRFHTFQWGHQSSFIDADIRNGYYNCSNKAFIADWKDVSINNGSASIVVWLRGQSTYYFRSTNSAMSLPIVYLNGYQEINGSFLNPTSSINPNINQSGMTHSGNGYFAGNGIFFGNVGIGTTTPQNALDVNGTIRAKEVKVETGWADYVFAPTYKLRPLTEVEQFIKINGHLPEIPKAEEVQQNGVNLGEMQTKLLQKVEELTLYSIEQEKQLKEQRQTNANMQKLLAAQAKENAELKKELNELKELITKRHKL